jgi:hypothetical protein
MSVVWGPPKKRARDIIQEIDRFYKSHAAVKGHRKGGTSDATVSGQFKGVSMTATVNFAYGQFRVRVGDTGHYCLDFSMDTHTMHLSEASADWVSANCDIHTVHKGTLILEFIDALAAHFGLYEVELEDAAQFGTIEYNGIGIGLTWLRTMIKGKGWYESHGYVAKSGGEEWKLRSQLLRSKDLSGMREAVNSAYIALLESPLEGLESLPTSYATFVRTADEYLAQEKVPDFGSYVAWLAKTNFSELMTVYFALFRVRNDPPFRSGAPWVKELASWNIERIRPRKLVKYFEV